MNKIKKHSEVLEKKVKERTFKLENANAKLKKLDNLKNDFIANITHDFRSPLTSILNITDIALRFNVELDKENKENYNIIYKSSLRLKNSIDRLLELARMDSQGIKLNVRRIDLVAYMRQILDYYTSSVVGSGIKIIKVLPDTIINDLYTDPEKLEEIIENIISNAIKFVDHNSGIIKIELSDFPDKIVISISDNGPGIPQDKLVSIFGRFEQAHEGRNSPYTGTGIGLAFARQLVEYLKGSIWAESGGAGATFFIELKKGKTIFDEKDFAVEEVKQRNREDFGKIIETEIEIKLQDRSVQTIFTELNGENELDWRKGVILIVDDDHTIRKIIMSYLENCGYRNFILASDGRQALDAVYEYSPALIVCDFNMPHMRGDEFHNRLLENPKFSEIPFIFLSAVTNDNLVIERRRKGAGAYLKKPIDEKIFLITVEEQIKKYFEFMKIRQLAAVDELTGLYNKRSIIKNLNHELSIRKYRDLSLVFFDIDYFKGINDTYGHQAGDLVLSKIGELIKSHVRNYDIAGRYGGDEFMIILPETNLKKAAYVADVLRKVIRDTKITYHDTEISIRSSFGVASLMDNAAYIEKTLNINGLENLYKTKNVPEINWEHIEKTKLEIAALLLKMADVSLYKAKYTICNGCGFSSEKHHLFINNQCPNCSAVDLVIGRNRVEVFDE